MSTYESSERETDPEEEEQRDQGSPVPSVDETDYSQPESKPDPSRPQDPLTEDKAQPTTNPSTYALLPSGSCHRLNLQQTLTEHRKSVHPATWRLAP